MNSEEWKLHANVQKHQLWMTQTGKGCIIYTFTTISSGQLCAKLN